MPLGLIYTCNCCALEYEVDMKSFWHGPLHDTFVEHRSHTQEFACDPCQLMLTLPKDISVEAWEQWKTKDRNLKLEMARYPFIADLVAYIDCALARSTSTTIGVETVDCPYCHSALVPGGEFALIEPCPRCGGQSWKRTGCGVTTLKAGIIWPPLHP